MAVAGRTGCHTERGRRPVNQDAVLAVRLPDGRELVAIADGMGGHSAGEVASQQALDTIWVRLRAGADLSEAVSAANVTIHTAATGNPAWAGMGTTLVAMLRAGSHYEIANVGDSRAYRVTGQSVSQLTADHTVAAEALREGMSGGELHESPWRNALTRALGTEPDVRVDVFGPYDATEPHALVLCTDGLHRSLSDDELLRHVAGAEDPWAAAQLLTAEAYRNGSTDNISAAVVLFGVRKAVSQRPNPVEARSEPVRRRRRSRRMQRTDYALASVLVLLILVMAVLMRVW